MNIIKKFFVFSKSGGLSEAINYSLHAVRSIFFVHSHTFFLHLDNNKKQSSITTKSNQFSFKIVRDIKELKSLSFKRLEFSPTNKWFEEGAICQVGLQNDQPVSFIWIHKKSRDIHHALKVNLGPSQYWIGPVFVHKNARGKGLNKLQLKTLLNNPQFKNCEFITCTNSKNFASVKSFLKQGFSLVLISKFKKILMNKPVKDLIILKENTIYYEV